MRGVYRVTFARKMQRGDAKFGPGQVYEMSGADFFHWWGFPGSIDCYRKLDPELGPYDRVESGPCVIVGCGPSLRGFDFELLRGWDVLVCNRAHEWVPWAEYLVTMDYGAFLENPEMGRSLQTFKKVIFTKAGGAAIHPKAVEFPWPSRTPMVSDSIEEGIHGRHSGMAAVNVAYCLGYDPIYFLGIDCKVPGSQPHFYEEETEELRQHILRPVDGYDVARMEMWRQQFDAQARQYRFRGVRVVNLGPDSALQEFSREDWQTIFFTAEYVEDTERRRGRQ